MLLSRGAASVVRNGDNGIKRKRLSNDERERGFCERSERKRHIRILIVERSPGLYVDNNSRLAFYLYICKVVKWRRGGGGLALRPHSSSEGGYSDSNERDRRDGKHKNTRGSQGLFLAMLRFLGHNNLFDVGRLTR